ncbi:DUF4168 domain-containing protein [Halomonas salinarum]|uniref:DUF4168 domain-containing protein n=1 Tax=Halomonas salinarum TaxID=1158993 RepID=UPI00143A3373|nr:DUF4168 domain-containing protein [Halomonas salinarum]
MQRLTALLTAALLSAGMLSAPAIAQEDASSQAAQAQAAAPATDFSDEKLQQFAEASKEIASVSRDYTERLQNAEDEAAKQEVRMEANEDMVNIVEDSGLEVSTFNAIGQAIQQDPELMKRVQGMVEPQAE